MFEHVNFDFTVDTLLLIILWNIVGTGLQYLLKYLYDKKKWEWSERVLGVVNFLMSMTAILIANKRHPLGISESAPPPKETVIIKK